MWSLYKWVYNIYKGYKLILKTRKERASAGKIDKIFNLSKSTVNDIRR